MPPGSQGQGPWVNPNNQVPGQHLKDYGVDLTALAKDNKLDPIIGRHNEIRRTLQILARRTKNNPVLVRAHNLPMKQQIDMFLLVSIPIFFVLTFSLIFFTAYLMVVRMSVS